MGRDFSSFDGISRASPLGVTAQATAPQATTAAPAPLGQSLTRNSATAWQTPSTYTTTTQGEGCSDKHSTDTRRLGTKKGVGVGAAASASFVVSGGGGAHAPISAVEIAAIAAGRVAVCN